MNILYPEVGETVVHKTSGTRYRVIDRHSGRTDLVNLVDNNRYSLFLYSDYWKVEPVSDAVTVEQVEKQWGTVKQTTDMVNDPPHYKRGEYEAIDVLAAFFPENPLLWQVGKYIMRAGHKNDTVEDLKKAEFYLKREIARLENL